MKLILADDSVLFREGLARVLEDQGFEIVAQTGNADDLVRRAGALRADVAIVDIRMPPSFTDEGVRAAAELGVRAPEVGVIVLSNYLDGGAANAVLHHEGAGRGYLLKDRVGDLEAFAGAIRRVAAGGSVVDPMVVEGLVKRHGADEPLAEMSHREREILALMAEGRSNAGICERLSLSPRTVESHVRMIFRKLGLHDTSDDNRRVLAVLAYLRS